LRFFHTPQKGKNALDDKKLLNDVWGEVPKKQTTAIMGPSGAGKTSLLNILAGRAKSRGALSIESDIRLDNYAVDPTEISVRKNIAFVAQDDSLMATQTPREAIYFSAKLRLPKSTTELQILSLVERMLEELGLTHCADTIVGGPLLKGISGGERKRTSVGVELVTKPSMVFLDEPTSGLDSYSAVQLCNVLRKVANAGASVLFTIHQPASEIFNAFDNIILMNKGRVMYQGSVPDVPDFFKERGHKVPKNYNPADWIMHVAQANSVAQLDEDGFFPKDTRALGEPFIANNEKRKSFGDRLSKTRRTISSGGGDDTNKDSFSDGTTVEENDSHSESKSFERVSLVTQTKLMFIRELKNIKRDKSVLLGRLAFTAFLATLIGIVFFDVGELPRDVSKNINSQFGALTMIFMAAMMGTAQPALLTFPQERPVFLREYSTNHYSVVSYFLSRLTVEIFVTALQCFVLVLIAFLMIGLQSNFMFFYINTYALAMASTALAVTLGSTVEDPKLATEMMPIVFVPQILFAGFFVSPTLIPAWLRWLRYVFSFTYVMRLGVLEEFSDCVGQQATMACEGLKESIEADSDEAWWYWMTLIALFVFFRLAALFFLRRKATKFL
jgi:ABC-type multidrug transport system ATPase subunit